jgi:hypothetical protein
MYTVYTYKCMVMANPKYVQKRNTAAQMMCSSPLLLCPAAVVGASLTCVMKSRACLLFKVSISSCVTALFYLVCFEVYLVLIG